MSLRDQIAEAIYSGKASGPPVPWEAILADSDFAGFRADVYQRADAVMAVVVQPELDRQAAAFAAAIVSTASDAMEHRLCNMTRMGIAQRAEQAEATIERVRKVIHIAERHPVTDWQRGYRACADHVVAAVLDQPEPGIT